MYIFICSMLLFLLNGCAAGTMIVEEVAEEVTEEAAKEFIEYEERKHKTKPTKDVQ